jgi:hypothetical protein
MNPIRKQFRNSSIASATDLACLYKSVYTNINPLRHVLQQLCPFYLESQSQLLHTTFGITKTLIPVSTLKPWKPWLLVTFKPSEKSLKILIQPSKNVLQYLRVNVLKLRSNLLDFPKRISLLSIGK